MNNAENQKKLTDEESTIEKLAKSIEETNLFKSLDETNQKKIRTKLKQKDFKIRIDGKQVKYLDWQNISNEFATEADLFEKMYNFFSLYAHPSYISVFQYGEMFDSAEKHYQRFTLLNVRFCIALASVFLGDYVRQFPEVKVTIEKRSDLEQIMLNFFNRKLRGDSKSFSEVWRKL